MFVPIILILFHGFCAMPQQIWTNSLMTYIDEDSNSFRNKGSFWTNILNFITYIHIELHTFIKKP